MNFLGDVLRTAVGMPTSNEVERAHNALVKAVEHKIQLASTTRTWCIALTVLSGVGCAIESSSGSRSLLAGAGIVVGLFGTFVAHYASQHLQEQLIVVNSNKNYVHSGARLRGTSPVF